MTGALHPRSAEHVADAVRWAAAEGAPVELVGAGTKRRLGHAVSGDSRAQILDLSGLSGITLYEPEELVVTVLPGTPVSELQAALAAEGQQLGFEPPDFGPLYGGAPDHATVGGVVACNHGGPRRPRAGAVRDHVLGLSCVSGRGEVFKCGGRVVKNVTGYDLCKVLTGSYGTLAALTEITLRVVPAAERTSTLVLPGLDDRQAVRAMTAALGTRAEVSAAAHVPENLTSCLRPLDGVADTSVTAFRLEGPTPSVQDRLRALTRTPGLSGNTYTVLDDASSKRFWTMVRDVAPFTEDPDEMLWRISIPPADGARTVGEISKQLNARWFYDWGGGLVWMSVGREADGGGAAVIRGALAAGGGHATLVRAADEIKAAVPVFHPPDPPVAALFRQLKQAFDPRGILNPGRMAVEG